MDRILALVAVAATFEVAAYGFYLKDTLSDSSVTPNRWSWLVWIVTAFVEALTYHEVTNDLMKSATFFVSAACCVLITVPVWTRSAWQKPKWQEVASVAASISAILIWSVYQEVLWAHYLVLIAIPVSFWPTWESAWGDYRKEDSHAWLLWSIGDAVALRITYLRFEKPEDVYYAWMELLCHAITLLIVLRGKMSKRMR